MRLRVLLALWLTLFSAPVMAQVNPGTSPLSIAKGGTGGATASAARTSLGLAIGFNVEAWNALLDCFSALATTGVVHRTGSGTCTAAAVNLGSDVTGSLPLSAIASINANTILGQTASGAPIALTINGGASCTNALTFVNGTGFGCNTLAGSGTVTTSGSPVAGQMAQFTGPTAITGINLTFSPGGRLTLQANTPVMTTSQSGIGTLRYDCDPRSGSGAVPYYNGSADVLDPISSCEVVDGTISAASAGQVVSGQVYDVWWVHGGANRICLAMSSSTGGGGGWASDTGGSITARGTGYSQLDFITRPYPTNKNSIANCFNSLNNYGPVSANQGTYLGTVYATANGQMSFTLGASASGGSAGTISLWNYFNQRTLVTSVVDNGAGYSYTSSTIRQARGSSGMQIQQVIGVAEDGISATYNSRVSTAAVALATAFTGIGLDSTSSFQCQPAVTAINSAVALAIPATTFCNFLPGVGLHTISANEASDNTNANNFNQSSLGILSITTKY